LRGPAIEVAWVVVVTAIFGAVGAAVFGGGETADFNRQSLNSAVWFLAALFGTCLAGCLVIRAIDRGLENKKAARRHRPR
jgi:hypothetical protein